MTLHVTTPDVTRYHSYGLLIVSAEFLCGGFVTNSVKNYTLSDIDDNDDNTVVPFDSSKAWMERVSINLLCTIATNLATPTFYDLQDLWRDWTLWRNKRWSERTMWSRVSFISAIQSSLNRYHCKISLLTNQILLKLNFENFGNTGYFSSYFDIFIISILFYL